MATVNDILVYIQTIAPEYMKMEWDNVGLFCGHKDRDVKKILVALDPFESVCREAIEEKADLLVTHHPLIFRDGLTSVSDTSDLGRCVMMLIENGIAGINAHTNLDCAPGGVNDTLAATLGLQNVTVLNPAGTDAQGQSYGLLRCGTTAEQPLATFLGHIKNRLTCEALRYADSGKPVRRVAVGGGSCGDGIYEVAKAGCDTFVTADVKYNQFRTAYELGVNIIDAGHFHTENPTMPVLAEKIKAAFPEIEVKFSAKHHDVMKFFI